MFHYLASLIGILAIFQGYSKYKKSQYNLKVFVFWTFAWTSMIIFALFPSVTTYLSKILKLDRPVDAVLYPSIVLLYYLVFVLYMKIENYNKQLTRIIQKDAVQNPLKKK